MRRAIFIFVSLTLVFLVFGIVNMVNFYESEIAQLNSRIDSLEQENVRLDGVISQLVEDNDAVLGVVEDIQRTYLAARGERQDKDIINSGVLASPGLTPDMFETAWKNLNKPDMFGSGSEFTQAEEETGVSSLLLSAIACLESAYGSSKIARDKNNFYGWRAYGDSPYHNAQTFTSRCDGTLHVARSLKDNYLTEGGPYFNGYTVESIGKCYAEDPNWAIKVNQVMRLILINMEINIVQVDLILSSQN